MNSQICCYRYQNINCEKDSLLIMFQHTKKSLFVRLHLFLIGVQPVISVTSSIRRLPVSRPSLSICYILNFYDSCPLIKTIYQLNDHAH